jgi:hypothetical protein
MIINPGSVFSVGRTIDNIGYVEGNITGLSRFIVNAATIPTIPTFLATLPPAGTVQNNEVVTLGGGTA